MSGYNISDNVSIIYLWDDIIYHIVSPPFFVGYEKIFPFNINLLNAQLIFFPLKSIPKAFHWKVEGEQYPFVVFEYH